MEGSWKKYVVSFLIVSMILISAAGFAATKQITIGTSSPSGAWMMLASTISKLINDNVKEVNVTPVPSPRGSVENIETIITGEREIGFAMANIAAAAATGTAPFNIPTEGLCGWFSAHYGQWYLLAREDSGIKSFADLKGKRIGVGLPGDGDETLNKAIFPMLGLKWSDFKPENDSLSGAIDSVKQNQIDAISYVGAPKLAIFGELMISKKMRLIEFSLEQRKQITKAFPYLAVIDMPQSDFPKLIMSTASAKVITMNHLMLCSKNIPEQDMYEYTKLFFENITTIHQANKAFEVITLQNAVRGMPLPFHPGAMRYYKEKGVLK